jgi:tripartite-type tricarboxylate transporter receptor subunit TctC
MSLPIRFTALVLFAFAGAVVAQPVKPTRMLVGFPPGGNVDILARIFGERLGEAMGRPVIVEPRPGAAGQVAAEVLKSSPPDGYTLLLTPDASLVVRPLVTKRIPYDPVADFAPVAHTGLSALALGVGLGVPAKNMREFADWLKASPERGSVAVPGIGGSMHFFALMIGQELGQKLQAVAYKGSGPSVSDVVAGHIPATVNPLGTMVAQYKAGKLRLIGVSGSQRATATPEAPTFAEQGYTQLNLDSWFAIFAPAGTPADLVGRMNSIVTQAQRTPSIRERMRGLDLEILELSPAQLGALVKRDYERWMPVVKASGFTAED